MRWLLYSALLGAIGYLGFQHLDKHPEVKKQLHALLPATELHTLEVRYTAEQIMDTHRKELLRSNRHRYLDHQIHFYPYLLMEVKYAVNKKKTEESIILWDLCDGEMVIETKGWEKTHGFGDCLHASTNRSEFQIIHFLSKKGGAISKQDLLKNVHFEGRVLDSLLESLRRKHLLVLVEGGAYRLHLEKPHLKTTPVTIMQEKLVTKTWKNAQKVATRFSLSQVIKLAKAAFGEDFAVRHTTNVYLPVHSIVVQNPDGSLQTSLWNALNGKRILYSYAAD